MAPGAGGFPAGVKLRGMTPEQLLAHHDRAEPWPEGCGLDVPAAYARALAVRQLRIARGEQPRGFKIGFTNRNIWPAYGVFAPIWGTVWHTTLSFCEGQGRVSLAGTCEPRLEPECVFGLRGEPAAATSLQDLFECIEWLAPGFQIVQTHRPGWKFAAADTVADGALHARLLVGPRLRAREVAADAEALEQRLAGARVTLLRGDAEVDRGMGAHVLGGPLHALLHFVQALRDCPGAPALHPGDVVTTGTWTDAWPAAPGERWRADFESPLAPLAIQFT